MRKPRLVAVLAGVLVSFSVVVIDSRSLAAEKISAGNPTELAYSPAYDELFFAKDADEFCDDTEDTVHDKPALFQDVPGTLAPEVLWRGTCRSEPSNLDAGGAKLYFSASIDGKFLESIFPAVADGSTVHARSPTIPITAIRADRDHIYWLVSTGRSQGEIRRVPRGSRSLTDPGEVVVAGFFGDRSNFVLSEDDDRCCLYWIGDGQAIRAANKNGTDERVVTFGLSPDARFLVGDEADGYLYWTEPDARILRIPTHGGPPHVIYDGGPGLHVHEIVVDGEYVYWIEAEFNLANRPAVIRRTRKDGWGSPELLEVGLDMPSSLTAHSGGRNELYFAMPDGVYRTKKDDVIRPDLSWQDVEVTQGIQDLANSVPLAEEKPTIVRAYPTSSPDGIYGVRAVLHGEDSDGTPLPGSPIRPRSRHESVLAGIDRGDRGRSFDFWLPEEWRAEGDVLLRVVLDPEGRIDDPDRSNNTLLTDHTFRQSGPLCLQMLPVHGHGPLYHVGDPGFWSIIDRFESLIPRRSVHVYAIDGVVEELECCELSLEPTYYGPYEISADDDDKDWILTSLIARLAFTDDPDECDAEGRTHMVGLVHPDIDTPGISGYANNVFHVSWVKMTSDPSASPPRAPYSVPRGGSTLAQEVGHNYSDVDELIGNNTWGHVGCGDPDDVNNEYPYPPCQIGPSFSHDTLWGFDPIGDLAIPPAAGPFPYDENATDFMSYGAYDWVSDYTWKNFFAEQDGGLAPAGATGTVDDGSLSLEGGAFRTTSHSPLATGEELFLAGVFHDETSRAEFRFGYRLPAGTLNTDRLANPSHSEAPFELELVDATGTVLASHPLAPTDASEEHPSNLSVFATVVPWEVGTAQVRVIDEEGNLAGRRAVSPNPPTIVVHSPAVGQGVSNTLTVEWESADPDGQPLFHTVQYSPDFGDTWLALAVDVPREEDGTTTYTVEIPNLPGSSSAGGTSCEPFCSDTGSSLVRVIASDGIHTASDVAGPFMVARRQPIAHIVRPRDGASLYSLDQVTLRGRAFDAEDGRIPDESFLWRLDGDFLGTGRERSVPALEPGPHTIELCVADSDENFHCQTRAVSATDVTPMDVDGDGVPDGRDRCIDDSPEGAKDTDGDGMVDACDSCPDTFDDGTDSDYDGVGDACDPCFGFRNDLDDDGTCDDRDTCLRTYNPGQTDSDADGRGDACDSCPNHYDPEDADCDGDGMGDVCQIAEGQASDCNANGRPDRCDIGYGDSSDLDGDGRPDECGLQDERCDGLDNDLDGEIDEGFDEDGDGWTTCAGDCDDGDPDVNPDASESCNGVDDDCDGARDEGFDSDGDGFADCNDGCPDDPEKTEPGVCGCGVSDADSDGDGTADCNDSCPDDADKVEPGVCGCGTPDTDSDGDGTADCNDSCPTDADKVEPGVCGCGTPDTDSDGDGTPDCNDTCAADPEKVEPGVCGCGISDIDSDGDGTPDCNDACADDADKVEPGVCGCGTPDTDSDGDGIADCRDVEIDVKPRDDRNAVQPGKKGSVPVAILSEDGFEAETVDPSSVCFGGFEAFEDRSSGDCSPTHGSGHSKDVDGDGDLDLLLHFEMPETGIDHGDERACLAGHARTTENRREVHGCDHLETRPR